MSRQGDKSEQGVTAIVLAAGISRRMGADNKLLLPFKGQPLVFRVVSAVCKADIARCIVVLGHEAARVKAALQGLPVEFVVNEAFAEGMGTSISVGVKKAGVATAGFLVCLSDMPLITTEEYNAIIHQFETSVARNPAVIVRPNHAGQPGNPVLLASEHRVAMEEQRGAAGCKPIVQQHIDQVVYVETSTDHVLQDADTPEAYAAMRINSKKAG
ncbi:MAG: nucleotidyltransferase family protein [Bacteroidota bacterium]